VGRARATALRHEGPEHTRQFHHRAAKAWHTRWESSGAPADLAEATYHAFWVDEAAALETWQAAVEAHTLVAGWADWRPVVAVPADPRLREKPLAEATRAAAGYRSGRWHYYSAGWDAAIESYRQALTLFRAVGDRLGEANTLQAIGDVHNFRKDMDAALDTYQQALTLFRAVGDRLGEANTLQAIGQVHNFRKDMDAALDTYQQALTLFRAVGSRLGEANVYRELGRIEMQRDQQEEGLGFFNQAAALHSAIGDGYSEAGDRFYRADALLALGRTAEARADLEFALHVFTALGLPYADWVRERLAALEG